MRPVLTSGDIRWGYGWKANPGCPRARVRAVTGELPALWGTEKYKNRLVVMFPVTWAESWTCRYCSSQSLLAKTILYQSLRLLTPTTSMFHHSDWPLLLVATMWLCTGSGRLPVPLPRTAVRSMVLGWSMQLPATGHCSVRFGGVNPSGTTTYSRSKFDAGVRM